MSTKHSHYFKDVTRFDSVDVYRVLLLFGVTDPCLQHSIKKLLVAGGRGGGKDISRDIQEAIDSLERWKVMREEETPLEDVEIPAAETAATRAIQALILAGETNAARVVADEFGILKHTIERAQA